MPTLTTGFTPSLYKYPEVRSCAKGITAVEAIYVEYCACIVCLDCLHFLNCKDLPRSSSEGKVLVALKLK